MVVLCVGSVRRSCDLLRDNGLVRAVIIYEYEYDDTGERFEEFFDMGTAPDTIERDGRTAHRAWAAQVQSARWSKGLESSAMGVHPNQVPEMRAFCKKRGLGGLEWNARGNPVFRSRGQRKRYMEARNKAAGAPVCIDLDGGYGDAT